MIQAADVSPGYRAEGQQTRSGWLVLVQGRSVIPRGLRIDTDCGWPAEAQAQVVEIEPGRVNGQRMHLCPFIDALLAAGGHRRPCKSRVLRLSGASSPLARPAMGKG